MRAENTTAGAVRSALYSINNGLQKPRSFWRITMNAGGSLIVAGAEEHARELARERYFTDDCVRVADPGLPIVKLPVPKQHLGTPVVTDALSMITYLDRLDDFHSGRDS